ncbi:BadF/BadG/BcrA/BcrD ATPase family protein [Gracilibacillus alcaliphilus]|uniref:BadF/BadG/BcrA/BcrD ATPase family protein n=1 Tax=Gracilibacillus alcaliphilus TaxID=1401441 RepID=UPI00195A0011|nr:BadF/BadG/BcrA/BcrD ATPase family protein [Gracilibacillus alcaliphilus]MBM7676992.1 N-acetylglucosamine kinase-like BadF-type ATPase [Gracilibacillus alcaliphilus]
MSYVIGIDGGGTKTVAVLADSRGQEVARAVGGASNPNIVSAPELSRTFQTLFNQLQQAHPTAYQQAAALFAGMSGAGHLETQQKIKDILIAIVPGAMQVSVDNDALIALYAGTKGSPGIVQISGTGSITYGINHHGDRQRIGGWGHLIGERGSGYCLGHEALQAVFAMQDQTGPATKLKELCLQHFQKKELPDLVPVIYHASNPKEVIASLAKKVFQAAEAGDAAAQEIVDRNGAYIGRNIIQLVQQLFAEQADDTEIPVVLAGSIFQRFDLLEASMRRMIMADKRNVQLIIPDVAPVHGAVMAAVRQSQMG